MSGAQARFLRQRRGLTNTFHLGNSAHIHMHSACLLTGIQEHVGQAFQITVERYPNSPARSTTGLP